MTRPLRSGRRAAALYALYVLLTTAFAVLVVQVGMHRVGSGRDPGQNQVEVSGADDRLRVRTGTPSPSASPRPTAQPSTGRPDPSASATPSRPARQPSSTPAKPPAPPPPPPPPPPKPPVVPPPTAYTFFLKGNGTKSAVTLPMSTARPTRTTVPNYDADRDDEPGLRVGRGGSGPSEPDPRKIQAWAYANPAAKTLKGPARVTLWYALERFGTNGRATVTVTLQDCAGSRCTTLGSGSLLRTSWTGGWQGSTFALGTLNRALPAGHTLRVTVVTDKDVLLAFDTTGQPSALRIG